MAKIYKVLDSRQIQKITPAGGNQSLYRVWVETSNGSTGSIDIPAEDWTAEKLNPILVDFAKTLDLPFTLPG